MSSYVVRTTNVSGRQQLWSATFVGSELHSFVLGATEIDLRSVVFWDVNRGSQLASLSSRFRAAAYSRPARELHVTDLSGARERARLVPVNRFELRD